MKYAAPHIIAWRAIWYLPVQACRILLCLFTMIGWGVDTAARMWRDTR